MEDAVSVWMILLFVLIGVIVIFGGLALYVFSFKNKLSKSFDLVTSASSKMDQIMKTRYDLVANLIKLSQNQLKNAEVFEKVVQARYSCLASDTIEEKEKNEPELVRSLKTLFEEIKGRKLEKNEDFANIVQQLEEIDADILDAKRTYNANVQMFNHLLDLPFSKMFCKNKKYTKVKTFEIDLVK